MCVLPANALNIFRVLVASKTPRFLRETQVSTYNFS